MITHLGSGWGWQFLTAFGTSFGVAILSFTASVILGIGLTLFARSGIPGAAALVRIYTYVFRSLPDILLLLLLFYSIDQLLAQVLAMLPGSGPVRINALVPAVISISLVLTGFSTELFKAGWDDIPRGQHEAAKALGFNRGLSLLLIILPQVYRKMIPHLGSLWLISMKETALLSIIGISDIVRTASLGARSTGATFSFYGFAIAIFIAFAFASSKLFHWLERRSNHSIGAAR